MSPVIPHLTNECLVMIEGNQNLIWPKYDEKLIQDDEITIVIQINGKKRGLIKTKREIDENELFEKLLSENSINKHIKDKKIKNKIFVPNKLMNLIV